MSTVLLLDKSTLQSLSPAAVQSLSRHYCINIPPVLLLEIIADLAKTGDETRPVSMSKRLFPPSATVSPDYHDLLEASLLGERVPMTGQIPLHPTNEVMDAGGGRILFFDEPPAEADLRRWREGNFNEAERIAAKEWRNSTRKINLVEMKSKLKEMLGYLPRVTSLEALKPAVNSFVTRADMQRALLALTLNKFGIDEATKDIILERWDTGKFRMLSRFAPYAFYCLKVQMAFNFGLYYGLISTGIKAKSYLDLQYLYYLPFTVVFATSDKQQASLAKLFLRPNQVFVDGNVLKKDLERRAAEPIGKPIQLEGQELEDLMREMRRQFDLIKPSTDEAEV